MTFVSFVKMGTLILIKKNRDIMFDFFFSIILSKELVNLIISNM